MTHALMHQRYKKKKKENDQSHTDDKIVITIDLQLDY